MARATVKDTAPPSESQLPDASDRLVEQALPTLQDWLETTYGDLSKEWGEALRQETVRLASYRTLAQQGMRDCPDPAFAKLLGEHAATLEKFTVDHAELPTPKEIGTTVESFELGEVLVEGAVLKQVDLTVAARTPGELSVSFGGSVTHPRFTVQDFGQLDGKQACARANWRYEPLLQKREVTVKALRKNLRFVVAARGASSLKTFYRLQQLRHLASPTSQMPKSSFGIISNSPQLCQLAQDQGFLVMPV
jgi:hypothetical protein